MNEKKKKKNTTTTVTPKSKMKPQLRAPAMPSLPLAPIEAPRTRRDARRLGAMERQRGLVGAYHALLTAMATQSSNEAPKGLPRDIYDAFVGIASEQRPAFIEGKMRAASTNMEGIARNYNKRADGKRVAEVRL